MADVPFALPLDSSGPPVRGQRTLGISCSVAHLGDPGSLILLGPSPWVYVYAVEGRPRDGTGVVKARKGGSSTCKGVVFQVRETSDRVRKYYPSGNCFAFFLFCRKKPGSI